MQSRKSEQESPIWAEGNLFDYHRSLARLGGDPALFDEIVALFLEDCPQLREQARGAWSQRNLESLARAAHSLKNLTATFDAQAATMAAAALEQHAQDGALAHVDVCLAEMERELERLQSALARTQRAGGA